MSIERKLFLAGVTSAALFAIMGPAPAIRGGGEMVAIAQNLAGGRGFSSPFPATIATGPTAVVPPLYPGYIALLIRLMGESLTFWALAIGVILAQGAQVSLLPRLSRLLFDGDSRPGLCAGALCIGLPVYSWMPYWDAMYTAAGQMLFCLASWRWIERQGAGGRFALLCGLCCGALALANPASTLISIPWLLFLLLRKRCSLARCVRFAGCFAAAVMLVVSPWCLRNFYRLGSFTLRTNLGMTVFASNNDCASPALVSELRSGCYDAHHPAGSASEALLLKELGEPKYDRLRVRSAIAWAFAHPERFLRLTGQRMIQFWFPSLEYGVYGACVGLITALSLPGLWMIRRSPHAWFLATVFLLYPWLYYIVVADYRYRYPILWLSLLPAGYAVNVGLTAIARQRLTSPGAANAPQAQLHP